MKFSGSFEPGKISENECLDGSILDAESQINQNGNFTLKFLKLKN